VLPVSLDCTFLIAPLVFPNVYLLVLPVSLDCPFLIAPLVFPNVYRLTEGAIKKGQSRETGNISK
jgi:hypothetical protein